MAGSPPFWGKPTSSRTWRDRTPVNLRRAVWHTIRGRLVITARQRGVDAINERPEHEALDAERLARMLHDTVVQRLYTVAVVLGSDAPLSGPDRQRCATELEAAIGDLRTVISEGLTTPEDTPRTLVAAVSAACDERPERSIRVRACGDAELTPDVGWLVRDFVAEALRNALKHARPKSIVVVADASVDPVSVVVVNDGVAAVGEAVSMGLGLRLLAAGAAIHRGDVHAERAGGDRWKAVLRLWLDPRHRTREGPRPRPRPVR